MRVLNVIAATANLHPPSLTGLGELDLTSIINRGIDVAGSLLAKQPSPYVSPNDPRYRAQPPQQIYYNMAPNAQIAPTQNTNKSGVGVTVDKNTLILAGIALLAFMLGGKR